MFKQTIFRQTITMAKHSVSLAIAGYGGTGVITTGQLLLKTAARAGYFGLAQRSFGPQIRGGESLSLLRFATRQVLNQDDQFDVLVLLDTQHVDRFKDEVPLNKNSLVIILNTGDANNIPIQTDAAIPDFVSQSGAQVLQLTVSNADEDHLKGGENIICTGLLARCLGFERAQVNEVLTSHFAKKPDLLTQAQGWLDAGWILAGDKLCNPEALERGPDLQLAACTADLAHKQNQTGEPKKWLINGSDAMGLGALKAGIRFVAAYPITPATAILEWMAPKLETLGGRLVQAEDELASINMIIGGSFGGVPSLTATSGPGLALMAESIGLAVASETPLTVFNVMRGGPSTGIPTKSEQSDLNIALHGLHGDAPHVVTAALSIADSTLTAGWSVWLAEHLQVPVIALSDQSMAQSDACIDAPAMWPHQAQRLEAAHADTPYHRYALTSDGISPMSIPGEADMMYTGDGLEHNEHGTPSANAEHHLQQLNKRAHKLASFDFGPLWADISEAEQSAEIAILCWGSISAVANEAAQRLCAKGLACKVIALRLIAPLQVEHLLETLQGVNKVLIVEQSHGAQFDGWLRAHIDFPCPHHSLAMPGPLPIRPVHIINAVEHWNNLTEEQQHAANC
jgi:2-oxoglutarate ferredoxin oxidoreductase subunit alpha